MRAIITILFLFLYCLSQAQQSEYTEGDSSRSLILKGANQFIAGDYIGAEKSFKDALQIRIRLYTTNNILSAHAYNNIGVVCMKTWSYERAFEMLDKAEKIYLSIPNAEVELGNVYSNLGNLNSIKGELDVAEQYYKKALVILLPIKNNDSYQRIAEIYLRYAILESQRINLNQSTNIIINALNSYERYIGDVTLHNLYDHLSMTYLQLNKLDSALFYYKKSIKLAKNNSDLPITFLANSYFGLTNYYIKTRNKAEAEKYLGQIKEIYQSIDIDSIFLYNLDLEYATFYKTFNDFKTSHYYYQKALGFLTHQNLSKTFAIPDANYFVEPVNGIQLLKDKADLLINWYKNNNNPDLLKYALNSLFVASELINNARNGYLTFESKLTIAENEASIFKMGIWCAQQLFEKTKNPTYLEKAFYFAEKSKSSILEATLQEEKAKSFAGIPDSLLIKEQLLKREIAFYKDQIYEEQRLSKPDNSKIAIWNNYLFGFTRQQSELKSFLEQNYPDYYNLKYKNNTINIKNVQHILDANTTLLEYTLTDSSLYIFEITARNSNLYKVEIDSSFYISLTSFLDLFRLFNYINQDKYTYQKYIENSNNIYNVIFGPLDIARFKENLIIIPDDILSYLPFEALAIPSNAKVIKSYSDLNYLLLKHTISYSYSSTLLIDTQKKHQRKFYNKLIAFAPEYISNSMVSDNTSVSQKYRSSLQPLPFALEEAEMVRSITHGKKYAGKSATEIVFSNLAVSYDIIHLAMHTVVDDENPLFSKLVFYSDSLESDEGLLTTNEIFGLKLKAKLAVLSSCSSGEGKYKRGEGVLSLARGFFYAGCPSLIMTLWKVEDESGLTLMNFFYKYLRKGYSKPYALRLAKIEYLKTVPPEKQHPFYWSAYISIGNTKPLYYQNWVKLSGILLIILSYIFIAGIYRKNKRKKLSEPAL